MAKKTKKLGSAVGKVAGKAVGNMIKGTTKPKASILQRVGRGAMDVGKLAGEGAAQMFGVNMIPNMKKDYGDLKKQIKGYKKGGKVKKTGLAKLHKGERVLTTKQAKKFNPKKFEATRRKVFGMGKKTY